MWGVTIAVAREHCYDGPMKDMPTDIAKAIYKKSYWDKVQADSLPPIVRYAVFDAAVNSGVGASVKWLQQSVGATPDGVLGPKTLAALNEVNPEGLLRKMLAKRLRAMTDMKGALRHYWSRKCWTQSRCLPRRRLSSTELKKPLK
jgi:lysozyme family protein